MKKSYIPFIYLLICISVMIMVSFACNLFTSDVRYLSIEPQAEDNSVSGSYRPPGDSGDHKVNFTVTTDGLATFHLEGAPESEKLTVDLSDEQTASLEWEGTTLDGLGPLTGEEQAALDNLMAGELAYSLAMIPLDIGCQGDEKIDARQVAALLVPLQMRFKYLVTERWAESQKLIASSHCDYGDSDENKSEEASFIMLSRAAPVPVVLGYFPFDAEGAVEPPRISGQGLETACQTTSSSMTADRRVSFNLLRSSPETVTTIRTNEMGPCEARCRGACGADCEPRNCRQSKELRCEQDEDGHNTGMEVQYLIYDCGLHQGCIDHDNCYDKCNEEYGCNSWLAMDCRHAIGSTAAYENINYMCDRKAIEDYGYITTNDWRRGWGPKQTRETFEYVDDAYEKQMNTKLCPVENKGEDEGDIQPAEEEAAEQTQAPESDPVTATVILTWEERTDLDLAASPIDPDLADSTTIQMSWEFKPEGTILEDDTVCPDVTGREELLLTEPGLYNISVGVWSGCIIGEQQLPHFATYKVEVLYNDGRITQTTGTIEGQIWQHVMQVQLP